MSSSACILLASSPNPVFVADRDGRLLLASPAALRLAPLAAGERVDGALERVLSARHAAALRGALREVVHRGVTRVLRVVIRTASREVVPVAATLAPLRDADGRIAGTVGVLLDDRQEAAGERARLERRARTLQRAADERDRDLLRARQAKDEFLAVLSHELRTPLAPILTWAQLLARERDPERIRQAAEVIERNVRLQIALVEGLLEFTRVSLGAVTLDRQHHDLRAIVEAAVEAVVERATAKQLRLECRLPTGTVPVDVDAARVRQLLGIILSNAVKFSPEGRRILVTLAAGADGAVTRICDEGVGIEPQFLPFVFEVFRQQEQGIRRQYGGLGVGLALAKRLVDLHGGAIEVKSDGVDRGTEVTVRLPLSHDDTSDPAGHGAADSRLDGLRLLLVEDSRDTADATRLLLECLGASVDVAGNGLDALARLGASEVDAILCDLRMPGLDGFEFLRRVRADPARARLPVIAVSGFARAADFERTRNAGFDGHIPKPFDYFTLVATLRRAIDERRSRRSAA